MGPEDSLDPDAVPGRDRALMPPLLLLYGLE